MSDFVSVGMQDFVYSRYAGLREVEPGRIHVFSVLGERIGYDVASGAVHSLDEQAYEVLTQLEQCGSLDERTTRSAKQSGVLDEIEELRQSGVLFSEPPPYPALEPAPNIKALCFNVTHDCNLRCGYCFAGGAEPCYMSEQTAIQAIDFLLAHSGPRPTCEIDFFGGEPLMNFDVVRSAVKYAREREAETNKRFRFTLTTNATLLNPEVTDFLNAEQMQVILSIDGRPEVHDEFRCFASGRGSHALVLENVLSFLESRDFENYYVRGTYTAQNLDFAEDARWFLDQGIRCFSLEPVVRETSCEYAIRESDLGRISMEYERLLELYLDERFTFFHFDIDLLGGPCLSKRMSGCGAGREYLLVSPDGSLYPCHQLDGVERFNMGSVQEPRLSSVRDEFGAMSMAGKEECRSCWARYLCGGGCHAAAWFMSGSLQRPDKIACEIQKIRLRCAIYAQAARQAE